MLDNVLFFSEAQAITTAAATDCSNKLDLQVANIDVGEGRPLYVRAYVDTLCTSGGSATVACAIQDSADDSTYATLFTSSAIAVASLVAGYEFFKIALPIGCRRYVKVLWTVAVANLTAGKFTAYIEL